MSSFNDYLSLKCEINKNDIDCCIHCTPIDDYVYKKKEIVNESASVQVKQKRNQISILKELLIYDSLPMSVLLNTCDSELFGTAIGICFRNISVVSNALHVIRIHTNILCECGYVSPEICVRLSNNLHAWTHVFDSLITSKYSTLIGKVFIPPNIHSIQMELLFSKTQPFQKQKCKLTIDTIHSFVKVDPQYTALCQSFVCSNNLNTTTQHPWNYAFDSIYLLFPSDDKDIITNFYQARRSMDQLKIKYHVISNEFVQSKNGETITTHAISCDTCFFNGLAHTYIDVISEKYSLSTKTSSLNYRKTVHQAIQHALEHNYKNVLFIPSSTTIEKYNDTDVCKLLQDPLFIQHVTYNTSEKIDVIFYETNVYENKSVLLKMNTNQCSDVKMLSVHNQTMLHNLNQLFNENDADDDEEDVLNKFIPAHVCTFYNSFLWPLHTQNNIIEKQTTNKDMIHCILLISIVDTKLCELQTAIEFFTNQSYQMKTLHICYFLSANDVYKDESMNLLQYIQSVEKKQENINLLVHRCNEANTKVLCEYIEENISIDTTSFLTVMKIDEIWCQHRLQTLINTYQNYTKKDIMLTHYVAKRLNTNDNMCRASTTDISSSWFCSSFQYIMTNESNTVTTLESLYIDIIPKTLVSINIPEILTFKNTL